MTKQPTRLNLSFTYMPKPPTKVIRIIIADDHELLREGFHTMLRKQTDIELVGEAENGVQLLELAGKLQPDVIITDIKMPRMDGIEATRLLTERYPKIGVIALTIFDDDHLIMDMMDAGAKGYLVKNASKQEIVEAVKTVYEKENYYCRHTSVRLAEMIATKKRKELQKAKEPKFTERETDIIKLICEGYINKEISRQLHLSIRTVEGYRRTIHEKMDVKNTAGIVVYAIQHGIYKPVA